MSFLSQIFDPVGRLEQSIAREVGPPALRRIEATIGRRPLMPLIGVGLAATGLTLIVAHTISAGTHADNFGGGPGEVLNAVQFRPWFRIALIASVGLLLSGIITLLLAVTVRIWWLSYTNQTLLPTAVDALRAREGKQPLFLSDEVDRSP